jgi:lipoate-protein ligase A
MTAAIAGRLLFHRSGSAGWNMAVDQSILESVGRSANSGNEAAATLRFYTWQAPTLSLGYFQSSDDSSPRFDKLARVRRSTGGGAILHHHELTYSLSIATPPGEHGARSDLYRSVHDAVISELSQLSVTARPFRLSSCASKKVDKSKRSLSEEFLCFQRRTDEDLIVSGYKVLGSAQRRSNRALLQHGSLLLRASEFASELPGIFDLTSRSLDSETLASRIGMAIGDLIGFTFSPGELTEQEKSQADQILSDRFESSSWWSRR